MGIKIIWHERDISLPKLSRPWHSACVRVVVQLLCVAVLLLTACERHDAVGRANEEGVLILGNNSEPQSFDPHVATSVADGKIINAVMAGLLRGDAKDDSAWHPGVAESWTSNSHADEWIFTLREDAVWSDGHPLTAHDFTYAYHRLLNPSFGGRYADMLYGLENAEAYNRDRRGFILCGLDEHFPASWEELAGENWSGNPEGRTPLDRLGLDRLDRQQLEALLADPSLLTWSGSLRASVRRAVIERLLAHARAGFPDLWDKARVGVSARGERTLALKLRSPMPQLPLLLLHYTWFPVPAHCLERHGGMLDRRGEWTRPGQAVGNGPFTIAVHRFNDYVEVRKNPRYHAAGDVRLHAVRFLPIVNGFTETRMFFDRKMHVSNNVPPEMSDYARRKGGDQFRQESYYTTIFYRLNVTKPPLNDPRVRLALSMAIDREVLARDVSRGSGDPAWGFTPPGAGYETPHVVDEHIELARRLLAEAGYPGGKGFPHLEILTTSREVQRTVAEAIQEMWKRNLGIHVDIRASEWTAYKQAQQTLQYDISSSSWSGDYLDPATFLDLWTSQSGNNNTGWSSAEFDDLITEARESDRLDERMRLLRRAEEVMLGEAPVIPLNWAKRSYLIRPEVRGWHPLLLDNHVVEAISLEHDVGKGEQP